jgi:hypothetical protein
MNGTTPKTDPHKVHRQIREADESLSEEELSDLALVHALVRLAWYRKGTNELDGST